MLEKTSSSRSNPAPTLHSLTRYQREKEVIDQISLYLLCPDLLLEHVTQKDSDGCYRIQSEALVTMARAWLWSGKIKLFDQIMPYIYRRYSGRIAGMVRRRGLQGHLFDECVKQIADKILDDIMSSAPASEFLEVRFNYCLIRRINALVSAYRKQADHIITLDPLSDGEGHETDRMDLMQAPEHLSPELKIILHDALAQLPELERTVFVLVYREGYTHQEVAAQFHVTDRTIRNWLRAAELKLMQWRNDPCH